MASQPKGTGNEEGLGKKIRDVLKLLRDAAGLLGADDDGAFRQAVADIARLLRDATGEHGEVELAISTNRITVEDDIVYKSEARENNLAFELFRQGLRRLTFKPGITDEETAIFVRRFAECRAADAIDEDFVSTLWREELPAIKYVAIDGFTEKIFMSDERFVSAFRGVIDDVMPGLVDMVEDDVGDRQPRPAEPRDDEPAIARAGQAEAELTTALDAAAPEAAGRLHRSGDPAWAAEHLVQLLARLAVKHPTPLPPADLETAAVETLGLLLREHAWQAFADAARTLVALADAAGEFPAEVRPALAALRRAAAGPDVVRILATHLDPEQTDFTAWARWHFVQAAEVTAPDLLKLINTVEWPPGVEFLKDLLRRQGTSSLEPWAERLKDDDPQVVLEVLDVILNSELGAQARPLLIETLRNPSPDVRSRAIEGLRGSYDLALREALLPLLRDPESKVRRAVVRRLLDAGDRSVSPYLANTIKAEVFEMFDEEEQRLFFEALARLGGEKFLGVFRERLRLDDGQGKLARLLRRGTNVLADEPLRRAAVSGLAAMGVPAAVALINEVRDRADRDLASHCEVALRLAHRGGAEARPGDEPAESAAAPARGEPADIEIGRDLMGDRRLFDPAVLKVAPPPRPRPRPVDVAVKKTPEAAEPAAAPAESVPLSELPLLGEGEVFLPSDERRLKAEPSISSGSRFRLTSPRAVLVGSPDAAAEERVVEPSRTPVPVLPPRIVERAAAPAAGAEFTHNPEATLEDLLASYLADDDLPGPEPAAPRAEAEPPPKPEPAPAKRDGDVDDLLKAFLDMDLES